VDQTLLVFITVAQKRSFTRTAEELHMTQPAVSQYIQTLEKNVGAKLLERTNKYVRLTKAGEIVYHHAEEIVALYTRMGLLVSDLMNVASGPVAIGASYTFGEYVLPHVVAQMRAQYPQISPAITIGNTREIAEALLAHRLDIAVIEGEYTHDKLHVEAFAEDMMELIVAANHPFIQLSDPISIEMLAAETWIVREPGSGTREATDRWLDSLGLAPHSLMAFGSTQLIKESVEAGLGITLLSRLTVRKELELGTLKSVQVTGTPVRRLFSLLTHATPFQPKATQIFAELLRGGGWNPLSTKD